MIRRGPMTTSVNVNDYTVVDYRAPVAANQVYLPDAPLGSWTYFKKNNKNNNKKNNHLRKNSYRSECIRGVGYGKDTITTVVEPVITL